MSTVQEARHYQRISSLSKWLQWLFGLLIVGMVIAAMIMMFAGYFSMANTSNAYIDKSLINDWMTSDGGSLQELVKADEALITTIFASSAILYMLISIFILSRFYLLFRNFRALNVFTSSNVKLLRQSAIALFVEAAVKPFLIPMLIYAFLWKQDALDEVTIKHNLLSADNYSEKFFMICIVVLASWILAIGREMIIDRRYTV